MHDLILKSYNMKMTETDFSRMSKYIYSNFGIKMSPMKKAMLEGRLVKRLRTLSMPSFKQYIDYLFSHEGQLNELPHMVDCVTTNKTDFFREPDHFNFLLNKVVPEFQSKNQRYLNIWSAGCSTGAEIYTIAMLLHNLSESGNMMNFHIIGSDISTRVLLRAKAGLYSEEELVPVPLLFKKKYFARNPADPKTYKVSGALQQKVTFQRLNFMEGAYNVPCSFDIVFCRNVLIYFDRPTQESVVSKLCSKLKPGGYLFIGHSESLTDMRLPLKQIAPTIFRRI